MAVTPTTTATTIETSTTRWNRAASRGRTSLPHCHPKYCEMRVAARQRGLERGTEGARDEADDHERQADLAERDARSAVATCERLIDADPERMEHECRARHQRERQEPAEREAEVHVGPVEPEVGARPLLLDRARREEEHLVRRHRRAEQRDRVIEVGGVALRRSGRSGARPGATAATSSGGAARPRRPRRSSPGPSGRTPSPASRTSPARSRSTPRSRRAGSTAGS